jgi:hypothetical protein
VAASPHTSQVVSGEAVRADSLRERLTWRLIRVRTTEIIRKIRTVLVREIAKTKERSLKAENLQKLREGERSSQRALGRRYRKNKKNLPAMWNRRPNPEKCN